jgi:hypothetical protein
MRQHEIYSTHHLLHGHQPSFTMACSMANKAATCCMPDMAATYGIITTGEHWQHPNTDCMECPAPKLQRLLTLLGIPAVGNSCGGEKSDLLTSHDGASGSYKADILPIIGWPDSTRTSCRWPDWRGHRVNVTDMLVCSYSLKLSTTLQQDLTTSSPLG